MRWQPRVDGQIVSGPLTGVSVGIVGHRTRVALAGYQRFELRMEVRSFLRFQEMNAVVQLKRIYNGGQKLHQIKLRQNSGMF